MTYQSKKSLVNHNDYKAFFVIQLGFEPRTHGLKGRCSTC
jgi:hypothetical protein